MNRIAFMKTILLLLGTCIALANARQYTIESLNNPSLSQQTLAQLSQNQRTVELTKDSLDKEQWLEVEKNEIVKVCIDGQIPVWETSLNAAIYNDSCLVFQAPTLIGVDSLKAFFRKDGGSHKINLAIGMKYLNFKNEKVLLGFNKYGKEWEKVSELFKSEDPERLASVTGTYLVDKYPVTNCEFTQLMWDSIPTNSSYHESLPIKIAHEDWVIRKRTSVRNENCVTHDTAASMVTLYQALKYANARSAREGLNPYYIFSKTSENEASIISKGKYVINYWDFTERKDEYIQVSVNYSSNGYRIPFYDEWMMLARGGDKKNKSPWGDSSATFEDALKYAKFSSVRPNNVKELHLSEPVGQLLPNGYGLYDMFGLVREYVLFEEKNPFSFNPLQPSCLKGGEYWVSLHHRFGKADIFPYWKKITYGYWKTGTVMSGGFRLVRNIGNNVKWKELETEAEQ